MEGSPLRYDVWIEDALRMVIRNALKHAAREGLPGEHHFYITFRVDDIGVVLPPYLRAQHDEEMTIVLQHQFENLHVDADAFEVTLYFKGKAERLRIPLRAITTFSDPSVNFGLQLKMILADETTAPEDMATEDMADDVMSGEGADVEEFTPMRSGSDNDAGPVPDSDGADAAGEQAKTGEVIALDTFRKK